MPEEPYVILDEPSGDPQAIIRHMLENEPLYRAAALGYHVSEGDDVLGRQPLEPEHREVLLHLEKPERFKMYLLPRNTFKSSLITGSYIVGRVLKDRNLRVLIDSEVYRNSIRHLSEVKQHLTMNPVIMEAYGNLRMDVGWREDSILLPGRTVPHREPTIDCMGVDVTKVGMHYDLIVADDLVSDNNVGNPEMRDKVWDHFQFLFSLLEPTGTIILVGTRWHLDDVYGRILASKEFNKLFCPYVRPAERPDGSLTFPRRLSKERLANLKVVHGWWKFQALYQNNPQADEKRVFFPEWIESNMWTELPKPEESRLKMLTTVDPAIGEKAKNDYTAIVTCYHDYDGNIWVVDARYGHWNVERQVEEICKVAERYKPNRIGIEDVAYQRTLQQWVRREFSMRKIRVGVEGLKSNKQAKEFRINRLQPVAQRGQLHINQGQHELFKQLVEFPESKHDDILDALAYQLDLSPVVRLRPTAQKEDWLAYITRKLAGAKGSDPKKWQRL